MCYPYLLICVVIQWSTNNLLGVIPLNRTDSPSPSSSGAFCPLFVCLCLWHYCVWCHKCCEFIWVTALLGLGKKWCLVVNSLWLTKFTPSTAMISHLREKRVWYRCHISAIFFFSPWPLWITKSMKDLNIRPDTLSVLDQKVENLLGLVGIGQKYITRN